MAETNVFTWVQAQKELVQHLLTMKDRQAELVDDLVKAGVDGLESKDANGRMKKLGAIDPFTYFFSIYKYGDDRCIDILRNLSESIGITAPNDIFGIPHTDPRAVWGSMRNADSKDSRIQTIWSFFAKAESHTLTDEDFLAILRIEGIEKPKLSQGLFLTDPDFYLNLDTKTRKFLKDKYSYNVRFSNYTDYMNVLSRIKDITDKTFIEISYEAVLYTQSKRPAIPNPLPGQVPDTKKDNHRPDPSLNQILFGPPGTGKTYNSINLAVEIADPIFMSKIENKEAQREQIRDRYKELVKDGRIVFTTFHQSMCYEDFIEGIKPETNEDQNNSISYNVLPGIFKQLCNHTKLPGGVSFDAAYQKLLDDLESTKIKKLKTPNGTEFGVSLNSSNNLNLHPGSKANSNGSLTKERLITHIVGENVPRYFKGYYQGVLNLLEEKYGYNPKALDTKANHVLIIDEINRGNVSQIFGELITLIEPDKRAGMKEALEVTLPYSKEKFSVPPNLYIIGTMNTADRSVEALDTALRRRFSFREIAPKYDLLESRYVEGINIGKLLKTINDRIEALLDKDHAIGHSYFLNVGNDLDTLKDVFFNEIIPLLQEYFYGNFGRIELVLGRGFVQAESISSSIFAQSSPTNNNVTEIEQFKLLHPERMTDEAFLKALKTLLKEIDEPTQD